MNNNPFFARQLKQMFTSERTGKYEEYSLKFQQFIQAKESLDDPKSLIGVEERLDILKLKEELIDFLHTY